jgi:hypothetical protein
MTPHQNWENDKLLRVGETKRHTGLALCAMNCSVDLATTQPLSNASSACNTSLSVPLILSLNIRGVSGK